MDILDRILDISTEEKARKALIFTSFSVLALSYFSISDGTISVSDIKIHFSKIRTIALGQMLVVLSLIVFLVRAAPFHIRALSEIGTELLNRRHQREMFDLEVSLGFHDDYEGDGSPSEDLAALKARHENQASKLEKRSHDFLLIAKFMSIAVADLIVPLVLALCALGAPDIVERTLFELNQSNPIFTPDLI